MVSPLDGLLVVDVTSGVAGQFAGRLLARYGAEVVLVEPPGGTPTRRMPPLQERADGSALSIPPVVVNGVLIVVTRSGGMFAFKPA